MASEASDLGAGHDVDAEAVELGRERVDQSVHAAAEAEHGAAGLAFLEQLADAAREGAHAGHRLVEPGRHDVEVEVVGVRGVHARRDRGDEPIEHGVAHARSHELPEAVGAADREDRLEPVEVGADRAAPADDAAHVVAERVRGDPEHAGARQGRGVGPAVASGHHEPGPGGVRRGDVVVEAELLEELGDRAAAGRERLGAAVEGEAVELDAADASADRVATLEHRDPQADLRALERGHEPGDAAADHDDVGRAVLGLGLGSRFRFRIVPRDALGFAPRPSTGVDPVMRPPRARARPRG